MKVIIKQAQLHRTKKFNTTNQYKAFAALSVFLLHLLLLNKGYLIFSCAKSFVKML